MFSTPQSKAFFSQQVIKGKLIAQQIQLMQMVYDRIEKSKNNIADIIKFLFLNQDNPDITDQKLKAVNDSLGQVYDNVLESNEQFAFQVSLRSDIKQLEHLFFKNIMMTYQEKIKELKHGLLCLQNDVQELEQKGLLPYVDNPGKNTTLSCKSKNFQEYKQKLNTMNETIQSFHRKRLDKIIVSIVDSIMQKRDGVATTYVDIAETEIKNYKANNTFGELENMAKRPLDKSYQIKQRPEEVVEQVEPQKKLQIKPQPRKSIKSIREMREEGSKIYQMLKVLENWSELMNFKLKKSIRDHKRRIELISLSNKNLKEGIRNYKKIMHYQQNEAMVRCQQISLTREQAIDFLQQMNEDLQSRFARRNIYMIISPEPNVKDTKSCTQLLHPEEHRKQEHGHGCLREVDTNLNSSFLDQCSYLISDRFIAGEEENEQLMV